MFVMVSSCELWLIFLRKVVLASSMILSPSRRTSTTKNGMVSYFSKADNDSMVLLKAADDFLE